MAKGEMPPAGALPQDEVQLIYDWIAEGMTVVEVAPTPGGPVIPGSTLEPKFSSIFPRIIQPNCVRCHRAGGVSFDLASYNAVMNIVQRNLPIRAVFLPLSTRGECPEGRLNWRMSKFRPFVTGSQRGL